MDAPTRATLRAATAITLVFALVSSAPLASALGSWESRAPTPESGGYGQALASTGSFLYLVKGYDASSAQDFWRHDPGANTWTSMSTSGLPAGTYRNGGTLDWDGADKLFGLAGARYSDANRREFWSFSLGGNSWTQKANTPCAQGAGDAATWSPTNGVLYAMIGSSGHDRCFAKYNPSTNAWTTLANTPAGIDDGASLEYASGSSGRYLYALRGEFFETSPPVQDFWRYDTVANAWSSLASIPETDGIGDGGSLLWAGAFDSGLTDYLFALGGNAPDETPGSGVYRYTISSNSWTSLADIPFPVGNFNGNRLGYAGGQVHYVQMGLPSYPGGGDEVARLSGVGEGGGGGGSVWVNEVELNPAGTDTGVEWVELLNQGTTSVSVAGWTLTANAGTSSSVALSGSIAAGGRMIVTKGSAFLDNSNEWLTLTDASGGTVDESPVQSDSLNDAKTWQRTPDGGSAWGFRAGTQNAPN